MSARLAHAIVIAILAVGACGRKDTEVNPDDNIPIACVLTALTPDQREREGVLLKEHMSAVQEVRERDDGFSFRYPPDLALFARMAELVTLEHRCCPFLSFQLEWPRGQSAPWLNVTGGARIKEFVRDTFTHTHS